MQAATSIIVAHDNPANPARKDLQWADKISYSAAHVTSSGMDIHALDADWPSLPPEHTAVLMLNDKCDGQLGKDLYSFMQSNKATFEAKVLKGEQALAVPPASGTLRSAFACKDAPATFDWKPPDSWDICKSLERVWVRVQEEGLLLYYILRKFI